MKCLGVPRCRIIQPTKGKSGAIQAEKLYHTEQISLNGLYVNFLGDICHIFQLLQINAKFTTLLLLPLEQASPKFNNILKEWKPHDPADN